MAVKVTFWITIQLRQELAVREWVQYTTAPCSVCPAVCPLVPAVDEKWVGTMVLVPMCLTDAEAVNVCTVQALRGRRT